jgi:hypothetical protein
MANLRDFFAGGLSAIIDSQSSDRGYVNDPTYNTQDGQAGQAQVTSFAQVLQSPIVIGIGVIAAVLLVALIVKK